MKTFVRFCLCAVVLLAWLGVSANVICAQQTSLAASRQLRLQNVGNGSGPVQLTAGEAISCGPNQACTPAFDLQLGETLNFLATAQCNTSYFVQVSFPCSQGESTTRPGQWYCSFVNHWKQLSISCTNDRTLRPRSTERPTANTVQMRHRKAER